MATYVWIGVGIFLVVVIVALVVIILTVQRGGGKKNRPGAVVYANDDVQTGTITSLAFVGGSTGGVQDSGWVPILSTSIVTDSWANRLYCNVSAFTSMATVDVTDTLGGASLTTEFGFIDVRVLVDGVAAAPGDVTFDQVAHVVATELDETELLALIEDRASANSFEFIVRGVTCGCHNIQVLARAVAFCGLLCRRRCRRSSHCRRPLTRRTPRRARPCPPPCPPKPVCPPKPPTPTCPKSPSSSSSSSSIPCSLNTGLSLAQIDFR